MIVVSNAAPGAGRRFLVLGPRSEGAGWYACSTFALTYHFCPDKEDHDSRPYKKPTIGGGCPQSARNRSATARATRGL